MDFEKRAHLCWHLKSDDIEACNCKQCYFKLVPTLSIIRNNTFIWFITFMIRIIGIGNKNIDYCFSRTIKSKHLRWDIIKSYVYDFD